MRIAKVKDTENYYIAENGFFYRRWPSDNKLHKIKGSWDPTQGLVTKISVNGKWKSVRVARYVAEYFMNATGNYSVYFINRDAHSAAVGNLRVVHQKNAPSKTINRTPIRIRVIDIVTGDFKILESVGAIIKHYDISISKARLMLQDGSSYKGVRIRKEVTM